MELWRRLSLRIMRRALTDPASRLPARLAPAILAMSLPLVAGCATWQARRVLPLLSDAGANAVIASGHGRHPRYQLLSALPGAKALRCGRGDVESLESGKVRLRWCGSSAPRDGAELAFRLNAALDELARYFPHVGVDRIEMILVPDGMRYVGVSRVTGAPEALRFSMAVRDPAGRERYLRSAVRAFVHEYTHIAVPSRHGHGAQEGEYRASVAETCVEYAVFGDSRGYVFESEKGGWSPTGFNAVQQMSLSAARKAYEDLTPMLQGKDAAASLPEFCSRVLRPTSGPAMGRVINRHPGSGPRRARRS